MAKMPPKAIAKPPRPQAIGCIKANPEEIASWLVDRAVSTPNPVVLYTRFMNALRPAFDWMAFIVESSDSKENLGL